MSTSVSTPGTGQPTGQTTAWTDSQVRATTGPRFGKFRWKISPPRLVLAIALVAICAAAFITINARLDDRNEVLTLARSVPAGHVLSTDDLSLTKIAADTGLATIPADSAETVRGRTLAYSLPAGSLLSNAVLGPSAVPEQGQALVALALKPGQFPPDVTPGAHVRIVRTAASDETAKTAAADDQPAVWPAVVTSVQAADQAAGQTTVLSVSVPESDAERIAVVADQVSVFQVGGE